MTADIRKDIVALLPRLRRFAYTLAGSFDEADDLVQMACERALTRLDQFEPGTRLDSWMFRIVRTVFIDETRRRKRRSTADDTELDFVGFDARIHEGMQARFDLAVVRAELGRMSEEHRAVLALVTLDGMSYQEAADTLGVPIGTVMSRLARARKRLAQVLESGDGRASDASGAA
ncbi:MAG: RNA polymerase sigma factor [Hyphomicrobiaceae bacterium]|nr:RNA polymerase sigma factor [Hyphomicrobiaceae bacterium]